MPTGIYLHKSPSEETRKKMSKAHMGEKHPFYGEHHSEETRKKISVRLKEMYSLGEKVTSEKRKQEVANFFRGRKHSEETKLQMRESALKRIKDGRHNFWNPNRKQVIKNLRHDGQYKHWSALVKARDKNKCQLADDTCDMDFRIVHHIKPWAKYPKLRYEISNGIVLCKNHHPRTYLMEKTIEPILTALVQKINY